MQLPVQADGKKIGVDTPGGKDCCRGRARARRLPGFALVLAGCPTACGSAYKLYRYYIQQKLRGYKETHLPANKTIPYFRVTSFPCKVKQLRQLKTGNLGMGPTSLHTAYLEASILTEEVLEVLPEVCAEGAALCAVPTAQQRPGGG